MFRARADFSAHGIEVTSAPKGKVIPSWRFDTAPDFLPSMAAVQGSYFALDEMFENSVRRIVGKR